MKPVIVGNADLPAAMEANYIAYFSGLARVPYLHIQRDLRLTILSSRQLSHWNTVLQTNFESGPVAAQITAVIESFRAAGQEFVWQLLPQARPSDLGSFLLAAGLEYSEGRPHMLADLSQMIETPPPSGLTIVRVRDAASFAPWYAATIAGFETSPAQARLYFDAYTAFGFEPNCPFQHFVGYANGQPVTSSTLVLSDGIAGIFDVSTIPAARRRGFGGAITLAAMLEARQRGYSYAALQSASDDASSVYHRLGFVEQYREHNYRFSL